MAQVRAADAAAEGALDGSRASGASGRTALEQPPPVADVLHERKRSASGLRRLLVAVDVVLVAGAWAVTFAVTGTSDAGVAVRSAQIAVVVACTVAALAHQQLYRARVASVRADEVRRIGWVSCVSAAAAVGTAAVLGDELRTGLFVLGWVAVSASLVLGRGQFASWLRRQRSSGRHLQRVVVVGEGAEATELVALLRDCPEVGFEPVGVVGRSQVEAWGTAAPWLGGVADVVGAVERSQATGVLIASNALDAALLNRLVRQLHARGVHVHVSSGLARLHPRRLRIQPIAHEPLLYVEPPSLSAGQLAAKRVFDVVVASALLVLTAPVLVVAALAIRISDGGPVFFRQSRVGRDGRPFRVWKLRTMAVDAEARVAELRDANEREGPLFKVAADPRVTRVGRLLRDTSVDELPQLLNVLHGDMSMVGPRPALPEEVEQFDEELLDRLRVKPGVSGLWQVEARDKSSFQLYRRLDLFYVENWSLGLDLSVLAATVPAVLRRGVATLSARRGSPAPWPPVLTTGESS